MKKKIIFIFLFLMLLLPLKTKALDKISILYYKSIDTCEEDTCIDTDLFNLQMMYLKASGYKTISIEDFMKWRNNEIELDDKSILLLIQYNNENINDYLKLYDYQINTFEDYYSSFKNLSKQATKEDDINYIPVYLMKKYHNINNFKSFITGTNEIKEYDMSELAYEIPVLNYHFLYSDNDTVCNEVICYNVKEFEKQLNWLNENGYKTLTIDEFVKWKNNEIELPKKSVLLTFDDGGSGTSDLTNNYLVRSLEKYDAHATLYLITGFWNIDNYISPNLDIQTHTHNMHTTGPCGSYALMCATSEEIENDFDISLSSIKDNKTFAYPFYYYDDHIIEVLKKKGINYAFVGNNYKARRNENNYLLPRYVVIEGFTLEDFISIMN